MTTAELIVAKIEGACAVTLAGGYAIQLGAPRVLFEPGSIKAERRNAKGRVTFCESHYRDGSIVELRYSESTGTRWRAK